MDEPIPNTQLPQSPLANRLNSWKEIAAYLKRDVTTVQRWEKREGMPVHRHLHDRLGSVYAFRGELDDWVRTRKLPSEPDASNDIPAATRRPESDAMPANVAPVATAYVERTPPAHSTNRFKLFALLGILAAALAMGLIFWLQKVEYFWKSPIANAQFQTLAEFEGESLAAALSHDGHFVTFLSDRDGAMDVWITQVGSGEFHNLTRGNMPELVNPSVRTLGFSHDDSLVTFWVRKHDSSNQSSISIWAVPTLGGQPKPYLEGVAEFDWSHDGSRLAYHTPGPGDPLFVSDGSLRADAAPIVTAPSGLHSHFPLWAPDSAFIYFVRGSLPDKLDIWRIRPAGGALEQITAQDAQVSYPAFLDRRTLLYLAKDADGAGPWIYSMDVQRRIPHRLTSGLDRYASLAASADGRRLVLTAANPKRSLWRMRIDDVAAAPSTPVQVSLTTSTGFSPRLSHDYLLYVSASGSGESIWKVAHGAETELWNGPGARILDGPAISPDGASIAFSVEQHSARLLYVMHADGTNAHVVSDAMKWQGAPAWEPGGKSLTCAAEVLGVPHLFRVPLDGGQPVALVHDYSIDPVWTPDGQTVIYSGPDIGTTFSVNTFTTAAGAQPRPVLTLTRGARHLVFTASGQSLVLLRGEIQHKDLWLVDLKTGAERQFTNLPADFDVGDFDVSPDGHEVVLERVQQRSDVLLLDLPR